MYAELSHHQKIALGRALNLGKSMTIEEASSIAGTDNPAPPRHHLWATWHSMLQRCNNPNSRDYDNYGGRGIRVCDAWRTFDGFLNSILATIGEKPSPKHQLDRLDPQGDYGPENIRWATAEQQARNKRKTMSINDTKVCIHQLSKKFGVSKGSLPTLIRLGWDFAGLQFYASLSHKEKLAVAILTRELTQEVAFNEVAAFREGYEP